MPVVAGRFACDPAEASPCPPGLSCEWSAEHGEHRCIDLGSWEPRCGDGQVDQGEACDGENLAGTSCITLGFVGGTLACTSQCALDDSACTRPPGCGDEVLDPGEDCDRSNLGGMTCESMGWGTGTLFCTGACRFDSSGCTAGPRCGNGQIEIGEGCDDGNVTSCDGCSATCQSEACGNGRLECDEECDGADLDGQTCLLQGYTGGALACLSNCAFDPSGCLACADQDSDGHLGFHATSCPQGDDRCDTDRFNWTTVGCASCVDQDGDGRGVSCDLGPDCDDFDPTVWIDCPFCTDQDGDGHLGFHTTSCPQGDDRCDSDPTNWTATGCASCVDQDGDGAGESCDLGPDCDDGDPTVWTDCPYCADQDGDGHFALTIPLCPSGDDRCDTDPFNWTATGCLSCADQDGDGRGASCDLGLDCDDGDPGIWTGCPVCIDADGDGYGVDCAPGPDCDDNAPGITGACQANGCPQGWAYIPAGNFEMGCNAGELDGTCQTSEQPRHTVTLSAYCMELTEVSVGAYRACKLSGLCTGTPTATGGWYNWTASPGAREAHPITGISWAESKEYCQLWMGGDLPTEAQWEKAGRGGPGDTRKYPWGASPELDCTRANFDVNDSATGLSCNQSSVPPGSWEVGYLVTTAGDSPYGLKDMSGNVWEWIQDYFSYTFYQSCSAGCTNPVETVSTPNKVIRGGSYASVAIYERVVARSLRDPAERAYNVGLRCRRTP